MALKFYGERGELKALIASAGIRGTWYRLPNGVIMLRCPDNANVHWAEGSKSIWFSGKPKPRLQVTQKVLAMLQELEHIDSSDDDDDDDIDFFN